MKQLSEIEKEKDKICYQCYHVDDHNYCPGKDERENCVEWRRQVILIQRLEKEI